jgi:hypothetical protein
MMQIESILLMVIIVMILVGLGLNRLTFDRAVMLLLLVGLIWMLVPLIITRPK